MVANLQAQGAAVLGEKKARDADVAALSAAADTQQNEIARLKVSQVFMCRQPLLLRLSTRPGKPAFISVPAL